MPGTLSTLIAELGLEEYRAFLTGIARPTIELIAVDAPVAARGSKFGGSPDLPPDFLWPGHKHGLYRFIGQVNLGDVPPGPHKLPAAGLISFFFAHDDNYESCWSDPNYVRAYYFKAVDELRPVEPPEAVRLGSTSVLQLRPSEDVPAWPEKVSDPEQWPIDPSLKSTHYELRSRLNPSRRYLLGYSYNSTFDYNPSPGPEWSSLLTLSSDDDLEWCWNDGDWLVTFIEDDRFRAADFSRIESHAG